MRLFVITLSTGWYNHCLHSYLVLGDFKLYTCHSRRASISQLHLSCWISIRDTSVKFVCSKPSYVVAWFLCRMAILWLRPIKSLHQMPPTLSRWDRSGVNQRRREHPSATSLPTHFRSDHRRQSKRCACQWRHLGAHKHLKQTRGARPPAAAIWPQHPEHSTCGHVTAPDHYDIHADTDHRHKPRCLY